jgi:hypothetical protein
MPPSTVTFAGAYTSPSAEPMFSPSGAMLTASPMILFDGKTLTDDNTSELWGNTGTGDFTFTQNRMVMGVDAGEYCIRRSQTVMPYYAGYPTQFEATLFDFHTEAGVTKRVGMFSSSAVAPHSGSLDGFFLEDDGTTKRLVAYNNGTEIFNVPYADWLGRQAFEAYDDLPEYDWSKFTVLMFDFLWLGGAVLRVWIRLGSRWQLLHAVSCCGSTDALIFQSPQQPARYEIRSNGGTGSFTAVCCQVSVSGDVTRNGRLRCSVNTAGVPANSSGTNYVLQAIRKSTTYRDVAIEIESISSARSGGATDTGILMLLRNPILSSALSYAAYGKVERAVGTGQTVTDLGTILLAAPAADFAQEPLVGNYVRWMTQSITNTADQYVLSYQAITTNQTVYGILSYKEHA